MVFFGSEIPEISSGRTMVEFARIHLSMRFWLPVVYQDANIPRPVRCLTGKFFCWKGCFFGGGKANGVEGMGNFC